MKFIIGKKLDMTQVWRGDKVVGVTKVQAGPCVVVQVKTKDKDRYEAVQIGFGERKEKNIAKPQLGHFKKCKNNFRYVREFRISLNTPNDAKERQLECGDIIDVNMFEAGDNIQVTGISKGKGFQGVVKRHGFHGQDKTHGNKDQLRMPGSIGCTGPAHVFKGVRMPGRMGGEQVTTKNLEVVEVDKENNILLIKGAVPGARNGLVLISGEGELKVAAQDNAEVAAKDETQIAADEGRIATDEKVAEPENKEEKK
ncbi:50S ribosomal protein L3 [Patescibacteria group bacterium]|nr:50S ribosomal protein L3 [Patescibacteria group bacterium]MBU4346992.1 50S ribosomal protein L3 [Patescibacteria group bacterium]MBU4455584.1 50S ribosomal protein L3 [Patescibacteria group bacterium]